MGTEDSKWRATLRGHLAAHLEQPLRVGDLFTRIGATIPLHHATRSWFSANGAISDNQETMRWACFRSELCSLSVEFTPPLTEDRLRPNAVVIPRGRACAICGTAYLGVMSTATCSKHCRAVLIARGKRAGAAVRQSMKDHDTILVASIQVRPEHRAIDPVQVTKLVESIKAIGLQVPIAVSRGERKAFVLETGRHRLDAFIRLGLREIPAKVFKDELEALLWSISENLHRAELTALERANAEAAWIEAMKQHEERSAEYSAQVAQNIPRRRGRPKGSPNKVQARTAAARELGVSRDHLARSEAIAGLSETAKDKAIELGLDDNQQALLAAAEHEAEADQVAALEQRQDTKKNSNGNGHALTIDYASLHCELDRIDDLGGFEAVRAGMIAWYRQRYGYPHAGIQWRPDRRTPEEKARDNAN